MTFDTYLGLFGIAVALLLYYFDLKKKLDHLQSNINQLLVNQEGTLTKQQAHDLVDLYLDGVEVHTDLFLRRYAQNDLPRHYDSGNTLAIRNEFERAYEQIVKKSLRKMVSSFRLRGGHSLDDLIGSISQTRVSEAIGTIVDRSKEAQSKNLPLEQFISDALLTVRQVNYTGKGLIVSAIDKLYPGRAD